MDSDVLLFDVLSLSLTELLERQKLALNGIPCDGLAVEDEVRRRVFHSLQENNEMVTEHRLSGSNTHHLCQHRLYESSTYVRQRFDKIRVLDCHVFRVSREDGDGAICETMNLEIGRSLSEHEHLHERLSEQNGKMTDLGSFSIILVLAGEFRALEFVENFSDGLSGLGQHGLQWRTWFGGKTKEYEDARCKVQDVRLD